MEAAIPQDAVHAGKDEEMIQGQHRYTSSRGRKSLCRLYTPQILDNLYSLYTEWKGQGAAAGGCLIPVLPVGWVVTELLLNMEDAGSMDPSCRWGHKLTSVELASSRTLDVHTSSLPGSKRGSCFSMPPSVYG